MDDILGGFEDDAIYNDVIAVNEDPNQAEKPLRFQIGDWTPSGSLSSSASWNIEDHQSSTGTDYSGLSKLRVRANLGVERQFDEIKLGDFVLGENWRANINVYAWYDASYDLHDRNYTDEVLDEYRWDADIQDAYIEGKLSNAWDIKIGRQVIVWGYSDNLRVLDQLNPLDNLEPGIADIEDLRRPVGMLQLNYFQDIFNSPWKLSLIASPELRFSRNPPFGSDFYAITDTQGNPANFRTDEPEDFQRINWGLGLFGELLGLDFQILATRRWQDLAFLDTSGVDRNNFPAALATFSDNSVLNFSRITTFGFGLQKSLGSWLFKQEANGLFQPNVNTLEIVNIGGVGPTALPNHAETNQIHALLGFEYFGLAATTIAADISARFITDLTDDMQRAGQNKQRNETALRITRDFMNEQLRSNVVIVLLDDSGNIFGSDGGAIYRLSATYELGDGLELSGGVIAYEAGTQAPFNVAEDNDRGFAQIKWSF